jgi:hypothetical protein
MVSGASGFRAGSWIWIPFCMYRQYMHCIKRFFLFLSYFEYARHLLTRKQDNYNAYCAAPGFLRAFGVITRVKWKPINTYSLVISSISSSYKRVSSVSLVICQFISFETLGDKKYQRYIEHHISSSKKKSQTKTMLILIPDMFLYSDFPGHSKLWANRASKSKQNFFNNTVLLPSIAKISFYYYT